MSDDALFDRDRYRRRPQPRRNTRPPRQPLRALPAPATEMLLEEEIGIYRTDPRDGLIARVVQTHSLDKAWFATRFADIVSSAMRRAFGAVWYVELFAGPGRLWVAPEHSFRDGSPFDALSVRRPFDGYFFGDLDRSCCEALASRVAGRHPTIHIAHGDANAVELQEQVFAVVPRHALVVLYLDPEGLDVDFATIDRFATHFDHLDLLVNFPGPGAVREASAGRLDRVKAILGAEDEMALADPSGRWRVFRPSFAAALREVGLIHQRAHSVRQHRNQAVLYDLIVASRHPRATEFFEKALAVARQGQRSFDLGI